MNKLNRVCDELEVRFIEWLCRPSSTIILWGGLALYVAFFMWLGFEATIGRSQHMAASQHAW